MGVTGQGGAHVSCNVGSTLEIRHWLHLVGQLHCVVYYNITVVVDQGSSGQLNAKNHNVHMGLFAQSMMTCNTMHHTVCLDSAVKDSKR